MRRDAASWRQVPTNTQTCLQHRVGGGAESHGGQVPRGRSIEGSSCRADVIQVVCECRFVSSHTTSQAAPRAIVREQRAFCAFTPTPPACACAVNMMRHLSRSSRYAPAPSCSTPPATRPLPTVIQLSYHVLHPGPHRSVYPAGYVASPYAGSFVKLYVGSTTQACRRWPGQRG